MLLDDQDVDLLTGSFWEEGPAMGPPRAQHLVSEARRLLKFRSRARLNVAVLGKVGVPGLSSPTPSCLLLLSDIGLTDLVFAPAPNGKEAPQNLAIAPESSCNASRRNKHVTVWAKPLATLAGKLGFKFVLEVPAVSVDQALCLLAEESQGVSLLLGSRNFTIAPAQGCATHGRFGVAP